MRTLSRLFSLYLLVTVSLQAFASVPFPYQDDFSNNPLLNGTYEASVPAVLSTQYEFDNRELVVEGETGNGNYTMMTPVEITAGSAFTVHGVCAVSSVWNQERVYALATNAGGSGGYSGYLRTYDQIMILKGSTVLASADWSGNTTGDFMVALKGTYNTANELELTLYVNDGTVQQVVSTVDSSPSTGNYFGLGGRVVQNESVSWKEWQVSDHALFVPYEEPFRADPLIQPYYIWNQSSTLAFTHDAVNESLVITGDTGTGNFYQVCQFACVHMLTSVQ